ncbi:MAG: OmpP1/FadL family transporter [Nitrospirota bacterium]
MRKQTFLFAFCAMVFLFTSSQATAAGFGLAEQSASAMGMASAFTAQADDASAVWYNPAALTQLNGTRFMGGVVFLAPYFSHENTDGTTDVASRAIHSPAYFYATHKLNDRLSLGFGINNPFGMATDWHTNNKTREVAMLSKILTTEFNPVVAYNVNNRFSVAAGVAYVYMAAKLSNMYPATGTSFGLDGSGDGWGWNVAGFYKISDKLSTGVSYRRSMKVHLNGMAKLSGVAEASATTSITLPDLLQWGVSLKASEKLTLNADIGYTWWSTYDKLLVKSGNAAFNNILIEKQWNDVWNVRVGGQYTLTDRWKLRAGFLYDQNPVSDHYFETRVPDSDRYGLSLGTGYTLGNFTIDAAYLYLMFATRNIHDSGADVATTNPNSLNGAYKSYVHAVALSIGYKF